MNHEDALLADFGARLRRLREELKLTQNTVANRSGIDARYYSRIEGGKVNVTLTTLCKVARAMKCPRVLLLAGSPASEKEGELCLAIAQMGRKNETRSLDQVSNFVTHVLGHQPDPSNNVCPIHLTSRKAKARKRR